MVTDYLSRCMLNLQNIPEEEQSVSGPLRVVPSSTGITSKRCLGIGFLSRGYREIGVFQHVAPPMRLHLKFSHETGLILRCAGKVGNPFQKNQGNPPSCRDQEGRRGSDKMVPGALVFPSSENGMSGNFWVASRVPNTISNFKTECRTSLETL